MAQLLSWHKDSRTLVIYNDNRQGLQGRSTQALGGIRLWMWAVCIFKGRPFLFLSKIFDC
jgi:hypothetical protein